MIQSESYLKVADNTGAKEIKSIPVLLYPFFSILSYFYKIRNSTCRMERKTIQYIYRIPPQRKASPLRGGGSAKPRRRGCPVYRSTCREATTSQSPRGASSP